MVKIKIFSVGKTKEPWLEEAIEEYLKRLKPWASIEYIWAKDNEQLENWLQKEASYLCLDPQGKSYTSEELARFLQHRCEQDGARLTFVIGGAEGLTDRMKKGSALLSLSALTFTHQICRLILTEQIYRAFTIMQGLPYHK